MRDNVPPKAPKKSRGPRENLPRYDQKLRAAKNEGRTVKFAMTCETYFTDEEGTIEGKIEEVDKFDVAIISSVISARPIWLKKSQIIGTEVL